MLHLTIPGSSCIHLTHIDITLQPFQNIHTLPPAGHLAHCWHNCMVHSHERPMDLTVYPRVPVGIAR